MSNTASIALLLLVVGVFATTYAFLVSRIRARWVLAALFVASVVAAGVAIWLVDVNFPLAASHWRYSGEPAPLQIAILASIGRCAPLCAIAAIPSRYVALRAADA